jgi:hypothetical protein
MNPASRIADARAIDYTARYSIGLGLAIGRGLRNALR